MPLHPPVPVGERILSYGGTGAGKTHDYFTIASMAQKTGSDAAFYVIDTDRTVDRMLATDFPHCHPDAGGNVHLLAAYEWEDVEKLVVQHKRILRPQDWLIVDMVTPLWQWVQDYYSEQIFTKDRMLYFMEARAQQKKGSPFDGRKDWSIINGLYRNLMQDICYKMPCNIYMTAAADAVSSENDAKEIVTVFGPHGFKPKGQKETAHYFHTVVFKTVGRDGKWRTTTPKDRGREQLLSEELPDFCTGYLVKKAGWKL